MELMENINHLNLAKNSREHSIIPATKRNSFFNVGFIDSVATASRVKSLSIADPLGLKRQLCYRGPQPSFRYASFSSDHHDEADYPQSTDPMVKTEWFSDTLCDNLSKLYAIILFMVGCVLYMVDILDVAGKSLGRIFNVTLILVKLAWIGYMHIDVRRYINSVTSFYKESKVEGCDTDIDNDKQTFPRRYGFTSGRHGESLYLKIGAAVFCLGYLIHTGIILAEKVISFMSEDQQSKSVYAILFSVLKPLYAFYQLFFIFKYSNLIINQRQRLSRFALMHCIASSLLFWVHTITQEALFEIKHEEFTEAFPNETNYHSDDLGNRIISKTGQNTFLKVHEITPFLYPFSIEYNILIIGFWIPLWKNIGQMDGNILLQSIGMTEGEHFEGLKPSRSFSVDCNKSNMGLFAGLLMVAVSICSIILFYILSAKSNNQLHYGLHINCYTELFFLTVMTITAILAFMKIRCLDVVDVTKSATTNFDCILLFICMPFIFTYSLLSIIPALAEGKPQFVADSLFQMLQPIVQTSLIIDGLRRCANSKELITVKPGRSLITFLIVANLAHWMLETFQLKLEFGANDMYQFYGKETWTIISHITLPVVLFYRFHSSVCLVDIWKGGYEADRSHIIKTIANH